MQKTFFFCHSPEIYPPFVWRIYPPLVRHLSAISVADLCGGSVWRTCPCERGERESKYLCELIINHLFCCKRSRENLCFLSLRAKRSNLKTKKTRLLRPEGLATTQ